MVETVQGKGALGLRMPSEMKGLCPMNPTADCVLMACVCVCLQGGGHFTPKHPPHSSGMSHDRSESGFYCSDGPSWNFHKVLIPQIQTAHSSQGLRGAELSGLLHTQGQRGGLLSISRPLMLSHLVWLTR